ncbi:MAG: SIS domain-containing protein [Labilithrix sp.]|nr:SIS domain-containing protein [Labilithrix sp.]MCW5814620.1 SIS domain-containing protein [Labilithrix sp.]
MLRQPAAVEATLAALAVDDALRGVAERFRAGAFRRVVLTGMGSSLAALHPLAIRLVSHGAIVIDASELIHAHARLIDEGTLVVAVSQSGRSAEIVRLVDGTLRPGALVGVTNTAGSPLATAATATLLTHAGEEATVSCKTYVAGLAALVLLGDLLSGSPFATALAAAPAAMKTYLDRWEEHVAELIALTAGIRDVFVAGRGASVAAAYTAGLILKESTRLHAEGMTSAALRHGPLEMAAAHVLALVYEGDAAVAPLNAALVADLVRAGARAFLVGAAATHACFRLPIVDPAARPLLEILPAQMLSLALAAHAGIEAGRFVHATKVTATE